MVASATVLFGWMFARPLFDRAYPAESDLDAYYLPVFLAPPLVWSPFEYGGAPVFADPENGTFYPPHALFARVIGSWTGFLVSAYVLAACGMYAYVYAHTRSVSGAAFAALVFSLSEALLERLPHPTILHAIAWLPLVLLSIDRIVEDDRRWLWVAIGAGASAGCALAGHPQPLLYVAYLSGLYLIASLLAVRRALGAVPAVLVMVSAAALLSAPAMWPLIDVSQFTVRQAVTFEEFVSYANSWPQMLSFAFPTIEHPGLEAPTYVGVSALALALLGTWCLRENWRIAFWLVVAGLALCLGAGVEPISRLAFALPLYDRFRIGARHLLFAAPAFAVLAGFGLAAIARRRVKTVHAAVAGAMVVIAMVVVATVIPATVQFDSDRTPGFLGWNRGVSIQVVFAMVSGTLCVAMTRVSRRWLTAVALVLVCVDLVHAQRKPVTARGIAVDTLPIAALQPSVHALRLRDAVAPAHQRILAPDGTHPNDVVAGPWARVWRIPTAGGYSSVTLAAIDAVSGLGPGGRVTEAALSERDRALDLLAVRYLVIDPTTLGAAESAQLASSRWQPSGRFMTSRTSDRGQDYRVAGETEYVVYENRRARPLVWMTRAVQPVTDGQLEDAVHGSLLPGRRPFDPASVALVDEGRFPARAYPDGQRVTVESVMPDTVRVRVSSSGGGFLVLSEAYLPGWYVQVDEQPAQPVLRTDAVLQGTDVPLGDHLVTFRFAPASRRAGLIAGGAGVLLVCGVFVVGLTHPGAPRPHGSESSGEQRA